MENSFNISNYLISFKDVNEGRAMDLKQVKFS